MNEYDHNRLVDDVTALKVSMATMAANMTNLTATVGRIEGAISAATPKQDMAKLESRLDHVEAQMSDLKSTVERGRGMLILANIAWAALLGGLQIWSYLHK